MQVRLPIAPAGAGNNPLVTYLSNTSTELQRALSSAVSSNEVTARIILQSPNGTSWTVTVTDVGELLLTPGKPSP